MSNKKEKPLHSLVAGASAGAVEALVTYPSDYVKTRTQFGGTTEGPIAVIKNTLRTKGFFGLYSGASALIIGNGAKSAVRFSTYDHIKHLLADEQGKLTPGRNVLAGLGAGTCEAIIAVTPSETIKTKMVQDARRPDPQYKGLIHGTGQIIKNEGFRGIYRGLFPVIMKQGTNSAVRFTSYQTLKQFIQGDQPDKRLSTTVTFGIGAVAGLITTYASMPFDVIKTRMQSLEARANYRNSFHCAYRIFTEDGITRFWAGTTPRLVRLVLAGGIQFSTYEFVMKLFRTAETD
ncbi:mitochondrial carrier [Ramaria rubella]|nr:mitochondrial carrier [Ramaria rubella]